MAESQSVSSSQLVRQSGGPLHSTTAARSHVCIALPVRARASVTMHSKHLFMDDRYFQTKRSQTSELYKKELQERHTVREVSIEDFKKFTVNINNNVHQQM